MMQSTLSPGTSKYIERQPVFINIRCYNDLNPYCDTSSSSIKPHIHYGTSTRCYKTNTCKGSNVEAKHSRIIFVTSRIQMAGTMREYASYGSSLRTVAVMLRVALAPTRSFSGYKHVY